MRFGVLLVDEASALRTPTARRTRTCLALGEAVERRWAVNGTPRAYQLLDVWGPAQFCTNSRAFPGFYRWRASRFFSTDSYERIWQPCAGVEDEVIETLRRFTHVVDRAVLDTRPAEIEIVHDIELDPVSAGLYQKLDGGTVTNAIVAKLA